jgi:hypothetical protein
MTQSDQDLETYMAIARAVAVEEAKLTPTTPELQRRAHAIAESTRDRLAAMRRAERAKRPSNVVSGAIRDLIRAMSDSEVLVELKRYCGLHPEMQVAYRNYERMPMADARSALEDVMSLHERGD